MREFSQQLYVMPHPLNIGVTIPEGPAEGSGGGGEE